MHRALPPTAGLADPATTLRIAAIGLLVIAVSTLTHRLIELPSQRWGRLINTAPLPERAAAAS